MGGNATEEMRGILPGYVNPCCARASAAHEALLTRNACLFSILPLKAPYMSFFLLWHVLAVACVQLRPASACMEITPPQPFSAWIDLIIGWSQFFLLGLRHTHNYSCTYL